MNYNNVKFLTSFGSLKQLLSDSNMSEYPEIAFSGHSNVGKSTLINKIFNRKALARVSATPGKTATINFYECDGVYMVDLPGYGYAKVSKSEQERWRELIGGYLTSDRNICLIIQLIDIRHKPTADDMTMIDFLIDTEQPFIIVFTKSDKLSAAQRAERMKSFAEVIPEFESIHHVEFSSVTGQGVEELHGIIESVTAAEEIFGEPGETPGAETPGANEQNG
jgi:GTP-binding protein